MALTKIQKQIRFDGYCQGVLESVSYAQCLGLLQEARSLFLDRLGDVSRKELKALAKAQDIGIRWSEL